MAIKWHGTIANGMPKMTEAAAFRQHLATIGEEKEICVVVTRWRNTRSNAQNAYYHGVVVRLIAEHTGMASDECHEALRQKFIDLEGPAELRFRRSTAQFTTDEFEDYIVSIKRWARAFLGVTIPEPNEGENGQWA